MSIVFEKTFAFVSFVLRSCDVCAGLYFPLVQVFSFFSSTLNFCTTEAVSEHNKIDA